MAWPNRAYAGTVSLGVYYTPVFTGSGAQPTWATLNGGLPATTVTAFTVDTNAVPADSRMYCIVAGTIYRRTIGDWAAVLTSAAAKIIAGFTNDETLSWLAVDPITGYVYSILATRSDYTYSGVWVMRSIDHGDTWTGAEAINSSWPTQWFGLGGLDAYNGLVVCGYLRSAAGHRNGYSSNHGVTWASIVIGGVSTPGSIPIRINPLLANKWYGGRYLYSSYYDLIRASTAAVLEDLNPDDDTGGYSQGGYWFDPDDVDHVLTMYDPRYVDAVETADSFATNPPRNAVSVEYTTELAEYSQNGFWVHGNSTPSALASRAPVYVSTDGYTLAHRSGTNWDTAPYTDAIPATCGGVVQRGLWVVFDAPTEGPTPPPGSTITPPGGTPITLGGTAYVQAVTMPGYEEYDMGEPMPGDRGAFLTDTDVHAKLHASDVRRNLEDGYLTRIHLPLAGNAVGDGMIWDGAAWVPVDITTAAELAIHTADADAHQALVTLGAGSDPALALAGQELTLADVLTPGEHTAIGNGAPHHAAVTLGGGSDPALALVGQALTLTLPPASDHYRMYVYGIVAGDFDFVRDVDGYPVTSLEDTE